MKRLLLVCAVAAGLATAACFSGPAGPGGKAPVAPEEKKPASARQAPAGPPPAGVPVLMYHQIGDERNNDAVISLERFAEHMEYLHRNGFSTLSLEELEAFLSGRAELPPKPVVITFDDGYRDTYEVALPILKRYNFKSTLFIPTGDKDRRISWAELREMKAAGMAVASHSNTHRELAAMTAAAKTEEIARSKELLDRNLGQDTGYFCYPNGSYDEETIALLRKHGYRLAVTIEPGWVKRGDNPFALKRVWVGNQVDLRHFEYRVTREDYPIL